MRDWFTLAEAFATSSPALPTTVRGLNLMAEREGWRSNPDRARRREGQGGGWEYHLSVFPADVQARLIARELPPPDDRAEPPASALWDRFARLPDKMKTQARERLAVVDRVDLLSRGMTRQVAVALVAKEAHVSTSTIWGWLRIAGDVHPTDRLAALAPRHAGRTTTAPCDPRAWSFLVADYLRPEAPAFESCHRRMLDAAAANEWGPIPSAKTLGRRLEKEFPRAVRTLMRKGAEAAARTFPHQTRDRSVFRAMEAVNADGHKFDVFVKWPDGMVGRPILVAIQDLYSGMILGWRLDRSENWGAVRLAFRDTVESFGIPEHAWLDNGRAFASKWISGRMKTRFRFKVREDEPEGLLTGLGIQVHWATPYHGQAKPIERAFRDLCEEIAKHPACAGAYTGNTPDAKPENYGTKALPFEEFEALVAQEIARHNARPGRRTLTAKGRSFADTFRASCEHPGTMIKKASTAQLNELLLAAESVTARAPDGSVHLGDNRYWTNTLVDFIGKKVVVRFDPQNLLAAIAVYTLDGRYVGQADCVEATGFNDMDAARAHARRRHAYLKALREVRDLQIAMSVDELARLLPKPETAAPPPTSRVVKLVANATRPAPQAEWDEEVNANFGRAARLLDSGVIPFVRENDGAA